MFFCRSTDRIFMQAKGGKATSKTILKTQKTLTAEAKKQAKKQDAPYKIPLDKLHSLCYNNIAQKKTAQSKEPAKRAYERQSATIWRRVQPEGARVGYL